MGSINQNSGTTTNGGDAQEILEVLIIGAGFTGCYLLHKLRSLGFNTKVVESGSDVGGVWYWSNYPGARVDSPYPCYSLSLSEVWKDWDFTEVYPGWQELRRYFGHIAQKLDLKKDMIFDSKVVAATFDEAGNYWSVSCDNGKLFKAKFVVAGVGFAAKKYVPDWKGRETCKAQIVHSSYWPTDLDLKGKKFAVVGNGATGVQLIQELADKVEELTAFIRTPNLCLPMQQKALSKEQQKNDKSTLPEAYQRRLETVGGLLYGPLPKDHTADTPEEREALFEKLWQEGGFALMTGSYSDVMISQAANDLTYQFWLKKTRARVLDPKKADIVAPLKAPHAFGGKRPSLEQDYYEKISRPNVHLVAVKSNPIVEFAPEGLITADGRLHKADVIALATGYDAVTGSLRSIDIRGLGGYRLEDKWKDGTYTHMGVSASGFPNFFFTYGPQSPTAFVNGPSCVEPQCDWVAQILCGLRDKGLTRINATVEAEKEWKHTVNSISEMTLAHNVDSWYMGANVPGKLREALNYLGGLPNYMKALQDSVDNEFRGFEVS